VQPSCPPIEWVLFGKAGRTHSPLGSSACQARVGLLRLDRLQKFARGSHDPEVPTDAASGCAGRFLCVRPFPIHFEHATGSN
jgi:hypothetical protein